MVQPALKNGLLRRMAGALEHEHGQRLGIQATMRIAKTFNGLKNRRYRRFRQDLFARQANDLYAENGAVPRSPLKIQDGWALDTSHSLPHLASLLEAGEQIICERGGVKRGGGERCFFQQLITDDHIRRFPVILDFATSNDVLKPVIDYMGFIPTLSVSKPLGIRLAESDVRFADPDANGYAESQLFHRDYHDSPMVYVLVALRDVTWQSGPFSILPAAASRRATAALRYGQRGHPYRIRDEEIYAVANREDLVEFIAPAGSVLFLDSSECFHYGSRDAVIPRYLMMFAYVSVYRADFGDLLRTECPTPVLDDLEARTRRAKYPINTGDSRLKQLLLDRQMLDTTWNRIGARQTVSCGVHYADV